MNYIGQKVIIRADRAGVFFGTLAVRNGQEVKMENVRRLWYWDGANSLSQMAVEGVAKPQNCRFTVVVPEMEILDVIEIMPCTDRAIASIEGVKIWKM